MYKVQPTISGEPMSFIYTCAGAVMKIYKLFAGAENSSQLKKIMPNSIATLKYLRIFSR